MTDTSTATTDTPPPAPPAGYPYPTWEDTGDFAVPEDLREHYRNAEPYPPEEAGYWQNGTEITTTREAQDGDIDDRSRPVRHGDRVVDVGDGVLRIVSTELQSGPLHYPDFLHRARLKAATAARHQQQVAQAREQSKRTCPCCGHKVHQLFRPLSEDPFVPRTAVPDTAVCHDCLPFVEAELRGRQTCPNGLPRRDAAESFVDHLPGK